jgi:hypothetical protein
VSTSQIYTISSKRGGSTPTHMLFTGGGRVEFRLTNSVPRFLFLSKWEDQRAGLPSWLLWDSRRETRMDIDSCLLWGFLASLKGPETYTYFVFSRQPKVVKILGSSKSSLTSDWKIMLFLLVTVSTVTTHHRSCFFRQPTITNATQKHGAGVLSSRIASPTINLVTE